MDALGYPSGATAIRGRLERIVGAGDYAVWVAEDEPSRLLGVAAGHLAWPLEQDRRVAQLTGLVVAEQARGTGVARALVSAFETWAASGDASRAVVTSASDRLGAHDLYLHLGFVETGNRFGKQIERRRIERPR